MLRLLWSLLILAASLDAAASELYAAVNRLRSSQSPCAGAAELAPLEPHAALERAARDLSQGTELQQALKAAGYRATQARVLSIKGQGVDAQAEQLLARPGSCRDLQERDVTEIGVYLDARQLWIVMAAPFAPSVEMSPQAAGQRVLDLVNQARAAPRKCGDRSFGAARALRWNETLARASQAHADDMARHSYLNHKGRDGSTPAQRVERGGYRYRATGENIAGGQTTPEEAVEGWLKSPGHCANVMNPAYTEMGSAFAVNTKSAMGVYWAQLFGTPR